MYNNISTIFANLARLSTWHTRTFGKQFQIVKDDMKEWEISQPTANYNIYSVRVCANN